MSEDTRITKFRKKFGSKPGFCRSILEQYGRNGDLSPRQWEVVDRMLKEKPPPETPLPNILEYMRQHPRLVFRWSSKTMVLTLAGKRARDPGCINITVDDEWIGRIRSDTRLLCSRRRRPTTKEIKFLLLLNFDPSKVVEVLNAASVSGCQNGNSA